MGQNHLLLIHDTALLPAPGMRSYKAPRIAILEMPASKFNSRGWSATGKLSITRLYRHSLLGPRSVAWLDIKRVKA
jgi:hypothetical protein